MAVLGSKQSAGQGAECETPHHTIRTLQRVKLVTEHTDRLNSDQAVHFIEIFTQLYPSSPLVHTNCKKNLCTPLSQTYSCPPLCQGSKKCLWSVWADRGMAESRGIEREEPSQQAPSESRLTFPRAKAKRFRSSAPHVCCLSKRSTGESSRQHKSPLGFYSCVSGFVSHTTALQLSDNPCSKETKTFQYSLGMRSLEKIWLLCHVAFIAEIKNWTINLTSSNRTLKSVPSSSLNV